MKVVAIKPGYFGSLRDVGDEFEVPEGSRASWFTAVNQMANIKDSKSRKGFEVSAAKRPRDDDLV